MQAADILCQRMKAVESAASEGSWVPARYIEIVPESDVSMMDEVGRAHVHRQQRADARLYGPERGAVC